MILDFKADVLFVMDLIKADLQLTLEQQGHGKKGSSKLIDTMESEVQSSASILVGELYAEEYWVYVDRGVSASRIPYSRERKIGGAKTSKYIQGLIDHWLKQGLRQKEAVRAAFATANKHKEEGMSTKASQRFSSIGSRQGFVDISLDRTENKALDILEQRVGDNMEARIVTLFERAQSKIA